MSLKRIASVAVVCALCVMLLATVPVAALGFVQIYPAPPTLSGVEGLWHSSEFSATVNEQAVYVYATDKNWAFFNYAADSNTAVAITFNGTIDSYQIRPLNYNIAGNQVGNTIRFTMPYNSNVVVQIQSGQTAWKLLVSSDTPEVNPPVGTESNLIYFSPGVYNVGTEYNPIQISDGGTIYIAGGAVVEGLFHIINKRNLKIRGRGVIAMGQWPWVDPATRSGLVMYPNDDGLLIEGITIVKSPGWQITLGDSDATIQNVKLLAVGDWYNTDSVQTWAGNTNTVVKDSFLFARDDNLNINNGTVNFYANHNLFWNDGNGAAVMFGWGGTSDITNIVVEGSTVLENDGLGVFGVRWGGRQPHTISAVTFRNITIEHAKQFVDMAIAPSAYTPGGLGNVQNMQFINIYTPHTGGIINGANSANAFSNISFINLYQNGVLVTNPADLQLYGSNVFGFILGTG